MKGYKKMHCDSSTPKLMSKFLLICSIFNVMVLPICVCGVVSELSIISSFLCLLKEKQLLIKIVQRFSCLLFLSTVTLSWLNFNLKLIISHSGNHIGISYCPYQYPHSYRCTCISISNDRVYFDGITGVQRIIQTDKTTVRIKFCVHSFKIYALI